MINNYSTLTGLFSDIARQYPDRIALKDRKRSLAYRELYLAAAGTAQRLQRSAVLPGDRVVCISKKNVESVVCFWGIALAGGIPVMLDHEDGNPANEAKFKEVRPSAIIHDGSGVSPENAPSARLLDISALVSLDDAGPEDMFLPVAYPDVCYILLTSGTTGRPKAVQISHDNVLHYTFSIYEKLGRPAQVRAIHASTFAADLGLTNFLAALISGGMLRILDKEEATDPAVFNSILAADETTLLKITPSHLLALMAHRQQQYDRPIDNIVLGGEKLSWETVKTIFSLGICTRLFNHYGPTETTIGAVAFRIDPDSIHFDRTGSVPLGSPLGDGRCFLLNATDDVGELCITGPGVSIGYFENDQENSKKFVPAAEGPSYYRTGDICRKLSDGNYEFLYRTDRQVKVKGYRIELGEIELAMAGHPDIESVAVCLSDNDKHPVIDAYVKLVKGVQADSESMRRWLAKQLPAYKVPSHFYFYTAAPYNSNGKIDMNALKKMFGRNDIMPEEMEEQGEVAWEQLAERCWKRLLNKSSISPDDHFFEMGGDSLMAIQLIGKLQRYGYQIYIGDLNRHPIFGEFVALRPERAVYDVKDLANARAVNGYTFSQRSFLNQNAFDPDRYCQVILLETEDKVHVREMALALDHVIDSHSELTTVFRKNGGAHAREKRQGQGIELGTSVLNGKKPTVIQIQDMCHHLLNGISLSEGILFVAHVFIGPGGKDYLYLACHHMVVDVISWNIIIDELLDYYEQILTNDIPVITAENMVELFFGRINQKGVETAAAMVPARPVCKLPDDALAGERTLPAGVIRFEVPGEIATLLKKMDDPHMAAGVDAFLLSALGAAVLETFSMPEISFDLEFHGRPQQDDLPDLSRSVAWWAVTLPVNITREQCGARECMALIEACRAEASRVNMAGGRHSWQPDRPDIRLNYLGRFPVSFGNGAIRMKPSLFNPGPTRSDKAQKEYKLYFTARFIGETLIVDVQYQQARFSTGMIEKIIRQFNSFLRRELDGTSPAIGDCTVRLSESNLPSVGQPLYNMPVYPRNGSNTDKTIFLTGVTGFLGAYLAEALSRRDNCSIYCLVRGEDQRQAEQRLDQTLQYYFNDLPAERRQRLHVLTGDLLSHNFGLSPADHSWLTGEVDLIVHAAADINLLKDYGELAATNVTATRRIIELAGTGKQKEIHYISTLAVSGYPSDGIYRNFTEDDLDYGQVFISNYEKSKFEAEKMIRQFFKEAGSGKIYRVGHIAADSLYGRFQQNIGHNRIFQVIKGLMLLKMIPDAYSENLSFSYVDIVARAIAGFCLDAGGEGVDCLHVDNPQYVSFQKVAEMLRQAGYDIEVVDHRTYRSAVAEFKGSQEEKKVVDLMDSWIRRSMDFPRRTHYIHRRSLDLMGQAGLYFPKLSGEWLSTMIEEGVKAGFFPTLSVLKMVNLSYA